MTNTASDARRLHIKRTAEFIKKFLKLWKTKSFVILTLFLITYGVFFYFSPQILMYMEKVFNQKFIFYYISEPIVSLLKFAFFLTFMVYFPLFWYVVVAFLKFVFHFNKKTYFLFYFLGLFLFYLGALFAYKVTFPYGIKFLISFRSNDIQPAISLGHFVNFFSFFIVAFGLIFEMPLFIAFLSIAGILSPEKLAGYRKEIFFVIVVAASIITPTPDAFNMSLLAIPLYLLFELGLFLGRRLKKSKLKEELSTS